MAFDKIVDSHKLNADMRSVANAIRAKGGTSATLLWPNGFINAISSIQSGGATTYNCEAVFIDNVTAPNVNFQTKTGNIKIWGWGQGPGEGWMAPVYLFLGNEYATYIGGPTTAMNLTIDASNNILGLPELALGSLLAVRGI